MKHIYAVIFLSGFAVNTLSAQTITSYSPAVGDVAEVAEFSLQVAGEGGSGVTWDFSNEDVGEPYALTVNIAEEGFGADQFPGASYVLTSLVADVFQFYSYYDFNGGWTEHGNITDEGGDVIGTVYSNPFTYFTLPISFGSSGSDTYAGDVNLGFFDASVTGSATWTVDGSGTLILPNATYTNVLRVRVEAVEEIEYSGIPLGLETSRVVTMWIQQDTPFPLLTTEETSEDIGGQIETEFYATALVSFTTGSNSVSEQYGKNNQLVVWPNPAQTEINLQFDGSAESNAQVMFFDLGGKLVHTQHLNSSPRNAARIDVGGLRPGVYMLALDTEQGRMYKKIVKTMH